MSIWKTPMSLEILQSRSHDTMADYLDIQFTAIGEDYLQATMPVDQRTRQPLGILNGGASCVLAETVGSTAGNYCVVQPTYYCVGLEINANHIRSVREGRVTATARPWHLGKSTQVWHIEIQDDQARLTCVSRLTLAVLERKP